MEEHNAAGSSAQCSSGANELPEAPLTRIPSQANELQTEEIAAELQTQVTNDDEYYDEDDMDVLFTPAMFLDRHMLKNGGYSSHPHYKFYSAMDDITSASTLITAIRDDITAGRDAGRHVEQLTRWCREHGAPSTALDAWAGGAAQLLPRLQYLQGRLERAKSLMVTIKQECSAALQRLADSPLQVRQSSTKRRGRLHRAAVEHRKANAEARRCQRAEEELEGELEELRSAYDLLRGGQQLLESRLAECAADYVQHWAECSSSLAGHDGTLRGMRRSVAGLKKAGATQAQVLAEAMAAMRRFFKDNRTLRMANEALTEVAHGLEQQVAAVTKRWREAEDELWAAQRRTAQLDRDLEEQTRQVSRAAARIADLNGYIGRLTAAAMDDRDYIEDQRALLAQAREEKAAALREKERLQQDLASVRAARKAAQATIEEAQTTNASLAARVEDLGKTLANTQTAAARREAELLADIKAHTEASDRQAEVLATIISNREAASALREEELSGAIDRLRAEAQQQVEELTAAIDSLRAEAEEREEELSAAMDSVRAEAQRQEEKLKADLADLRTAAEGKEARLKALLTSQKAEADRRHSDLEATMAANAAAAAQAEESLKLAAKTEREEMEAKLAALQAQSTKQATTLKDLERQVKDATKKRVAAESLATRNAGKLAHQIAINQNLTHMVQVITGEREAAVNSKAEVEKNLKAVQKEAAANKVKLERCQAEKTATETANAALQKRVQALTNIEAEYNNVRGKLKLLQELETKLAHALDEKAKAEAQKLDAQRVTSQATAAKKKAEASDRESKQEIARLRTRIQEVEAAAEKQSTEADRRLQDVQDAHAELEARHAAVVDVLSRIENRTRVDLHNEVQDLAAKLAAAQQRLQQEHALRNSVTHQLQASQASVTGKDMQLQAARVELAAAKQQLESKEQELQAAQRQQVADMQRADAAKAALDQERQRAGDLTGELRAANRRRQQDASVLQNRLAAAEREFQQQFKSQAEHHQAELLSLNVALQDVLRANEELRRENKGLHTQLEACDSRGA